MIRNFLLYKRSIEYLLPKQIFYRVYYFLIKIKFNLNYYDYDIRFHYKNKLLHLKKKNSIIKKQTFKFINLKFKINHKWQIKNDNKLWIYNLNYFDYLNSNYTDKKYLNNLINDWINLNKGGNQIGLDPYPTSLRIVNWVKYFIDNNICNKKFENNLFNQIIFLSKNFEYHLLGNHYFANIKAIIFGCLYFNSKVLDTLLEKCLKKLFVELNSQILNDGAHGEFSPMYHSIILEDLLDIISIFKFYNYKIEENLHKLINKKIHLMFFWLRQLTHPDNTYCKFNDTTEKIAQPYSKLLKFAQILDFKIEVPDNKSIYLLNSGFYSHRSKNVFFCIKTGKSSLDHLSGHTHADTFSFELSYKNIIFFSNGGISTYSISIQREFERSSANHNTAIINNQNSSEVWKSFRLARRAKVGKLRINNQSNIKRISNFYYDYKNEYKHTRIVEFRKKKFVLIDKNNNFNFYSRLILRPDIKIKKLRDDEVILCKKNISLKVISKTGKLNINRFHFKKEFNLFSSTYCIDLNSNLNQSIYEIILL